MQGIQLMVYSLCRVYSWQYTHYAGIQLILWYRVDTDLQIHITHTGYHNTILAMQGIQLAVYSLCRYTVDTILTMQGIQLAVYSLCRVYWWSYTHYARYTVSSILTMQGIQLAVYLLCRIYTWWYTHYAGYMVDSILTMQSIQLILYSLLHIWKYFLGVHFLFLSIVSKKIISYVFY